MENLESGENDLGSYSSSSKNEGFIDSIFDQFKDLNKIRLVISIALLCFLVILSLTLILDALILIISLFLTLGSSAVSTLGNVFLMFGVIYAFLGFFACGGTIFGIYLSTAKEADLRWFAKCCPR